MAFSSVKLTKSLGLITFRYCRTDNIRPVQHRESGSGLHYNRLIQMTIRLFAVTDTPGICHFTFIYCTTEVVQNVKIAMKVPDYSQPSSNLSVYWVKDECQPGPLFYVCFGQHPGDYIGFTVSAHWVGVIIVYQMLTWRTNNLFAYKSYGECQP